MSEKEKLVVQQKSVNTWQTYLLWGSVILSGILLWWVFKREKSVTLDLNGTHLLMGGIVLAALAYMYFKRKNPKRLPPADRVAFDVAQWFWTNGYGVLDYTHSEVEPISDTDALVHFPSSGQTFQYNADIGVVANKYKDLEQTLRIRESHDIVKNLTQHQQAKQRLASELEARGFPVDIE